ncbi:hypothetical protein ABPG75_006575 [Micractinium tetrahymenae]
MPPGTPPAARAPALGRPADNAQFLRKQRAAAEAIAADNQKLKEELMLENKFSVNPTTQTAAALIANLQEQADVYAAKITEEQRLKAELEHQVEVLRQKIAEQRVAMGGINNSADQAVRVQRRIRILEDRLQQSTVRYNEMLTRSGALRARIDSLRRERLLFEELAGKLGRGLERRKGEMVEVIARIAEAHEAREKAIILQGQVKAQAEKDVANYEAEWRQLTDMVEADRRAREAQRQREIAAREAQMATLFKQEFALPAGKQRRSTLRAPPGSGGAAAPAAGGEKAAAAAAGDAALASAERVRQLKEEFSKVLAATGAADVDELLEALVAAEEANFSLFNYVNDLSGEVDKLEEGIGGLRSEVERYRAETLAAANGDRAVALRCAANALAAEEEAAEEYEGKHRQASAVVEALRTAVLDMFTRTGCATPEVLELLGGEGVSEKNVMQYLGVLEQRTNELLAQYCMLADSGSGAAGTDAATERAAAVLMGKGAAQTPLRFVIEPPTSAAAAGGAGGRVGDEPAAAAQGPADDERPLSRGSLAARARRAVAAKADSAVRIKAVRAPSSVAGERR